MSDLIGRETEALKVIAAAQRVHGGCVAETCGGTPLDPCELAHALNAYNGPGALRAELYPAGTIGAEEQRSLPEVCGLEWVASTFLHIEQGDRLRIGQDEATVLSVFRSVWHTREGGWIEQRDPRGQVIRKEDGSAKMEREMIPWERVELFAELDILPQRTQFPTDTAVEILCDAERKAQLALSEAGLEPKNA